MGPRSASKFKDETRGQGSSSFIAISTNHPCDSGQEGMLSFGVDAYKTMRTVFTG